MGREGSGVTLGVIDPDWLGFHIALKAVSFSVQCGLGWQGTGLAQATRESDDATSGVKSSF